MNIIDYDKIELQFEEFSVIIPNNVIEKFQIDKVEQLIEKKYKLEDIYNVYIVINKILAEEVWKKELSKKCPRPYYYQSLTECINSNSIYDIRIYKDDKLIENYSPAWSYTEFDNEYQKIGITDDKIIIRIKEI